MSDFFSKKLLDLYQMYTHIKHIYTNSTSTIGEFIKATKYFISDQKEVDFSQFPSPHIFEQFYYLFDLLVYLLSSNEDPQLDIARYQMILQCLDIDGDTASIIKKYGGCYINGYKKLSLENKYKKEVTHLIKLKNGNLLSASKDLVANIWKNQQIISKIDLYTDIINFHELSDGRIFIVTLMGIVIWNPQTNVNQYFTIVTLPDFIVTSALLPYNRLILGYRNGDLVIWNKNKQSMLGGHATKITAIVVDGNTIITGSEDGIIKIWDDEELKITHKFYSVGVSVISILSNNRFISGSNDGSLCYYDRQIKYFLHGYGNKIIDIKVLSKDTIMSVSQNRTVIVWDLITETQKRKFDLHYRIKSIHILPNNDILVLHVHSIQICNPNGTVETVIQVPQIETILPVRGGFITGSIDGEIAIWE